MQSFLSRNKKLINRRGYSNSQVYNMAQEIGNAKSIEIVL